MMRILLFRILFGQQPGEVFPTTAGQQLDSYKFNDV